MSDVTSVSDAIAREYVGKQVIACQIQGKLIRIRQIPGYQIADIETASGTMIPVNLTIVMNDKKEYLLK
jgi:hypothetical protein